MAALIGGAAPALAQQAPQEIVVTATGRAAAIQDVPLAVTAVAAETIENAGITDLRQIEQLAPSYRFFTGQSNAAGTTAFIRGIGTGGDNPGFESAVGFFIDGVYRNRSGVALGELPEVQRVEVLRGPQGTLFGRNTSAGAISVTTAGPEFSPRGFVTANAGNYDLRSGEAGITGPIIEDVLAVRLDAGFTYRDGFIDDVRSDTDVNDRDRRYVRGQALWDITPDASLRVIADWSETDENCCAAVLSQPGTTFPAVQALGQLVGGVGFPSRNPEDRKIAVSPNRAYVEDVEDQGISAQLDWAIGDVNFTSISSVRDWNVVRDQDIDFTDFDRAYRDDYTVGFDTFTQEFRLQGERGRLNWLLGAFYINEELSLRDTVRFGNDAARFVDVLAAGVDLTGDGVGDGFSVYRSLNPNAPLLFQAALTPTAGAAGATAFANALLGAAPVPGSGQVGDVYGIDTTGYAIFTHNEIALTDQLTLTVGLRWNSEEKDLSANLNSNVAGCAVLQNPQLNPIAQAVLASPLASFLVFACNPTVNSAANGLYTDTREDEAWTGTASLAYKPTQNLLLYTGYSRGFKAGGYNLDRAALGLTPASTARPSVNALEFNEELVDSYEAGFKATLAGGRVFFNGNFFWQEITDYQLNAFSGFSFVSFNLPAVVSRGAEFDLNARLGDYLSWQGGLLYNEAFVDENFTVPVVGAPAGAGGTFREGDPLAFAPEWTISSAVTYRRPIPGTDLEGLIYVDGRWNSEYRVITLNRTANAARTDNDSFATFNGRIGIGRQDGRWSFEVFGRNLTDEFYNIGAFTVPEQDNVAVYPSEPRTWGVTLRTSF